jgi:hypothetical protein
MEEMTSYGETLNTFSFMKIDIDAQFICLNKTLGRTDLGYNSDESIQTFRSCLQVFSELRKKHMNNINIDL